MTRNPMRRSHACVAVVGIAAGATAAFGTSLAIDWHSIDGGGGTSAGGTLVLTGTIGQHDAHSAPATMTGGTLSLTGGFWAASVIQTCLADLDHSGIVNGLDLALVLGQWTGAATYSPCPPLKPEDLNRDCTVNGLDLALLLGAWGPCS